MRPIDSIVIHCSDTPETMDVGADTIELWHRDRAKMGEPWSHYIDHDGEMRYIGYHYVIKRNAMIEEGRPISEVGCHCKGMNKGSIGVCWVGRSVLSTNQKGALVTFVAALCIEHGLSVVDIYGHNQFSTKTCPNFNSPSTFESMDEFKMQVYKAIKQLK